MDRTGRDEGPAREEQPNDSRRDPDLDPRAAQDPHGTNPSGASPDNEPTAPLPTADANDAYGATINPADDQPTYPEDEPTVVSPQEPYEPASGGGLATVNEDVWLPTRIPARADIARRGIYSPRLGERARRRRRYVFYVRRSIRARNLARSQLFSRVAWISLLVTGVMLATILTSSLGVAAAYYQSESPNIARLQGTVAGHDSVRIYDDKGTMLYEASDFGAQNSIPLAQIPITVINATVAIEDRTFWVNQGVDFTSIVRAALADYQNGSISQGGSTITQQLIKQQVLSSDTTFDRKLREAILAIGITETGAYTKSQIMELYLNSVPYGEEAYGIDAAAQAYFGYTDNPTTGVSGAQHLDLAQASMLAGIPQNPNTNDPFNDFEHAHARQHDVLAAMVSAGYITQKQADDAYAEAAGKNFFHPVSSGKKLAGHFVDYILGQLQDMIDTGELKLSRSGLKVYTTLDLDMQNAAQKAITDHLYGDDRDDYDGYLIRNDHVTNAAALLVDHHNGDIKVMLGSADYYNSKLPGGGQFNVVTDGFRGPGSSFKPIVYATAFAKGWAPAMTISDMPTVFWDSGADKPYKPLDFNYQDFWGTITLRNALQNSLNIPAVKVMQFAGVDDVKQMAMRMGITEWPSSATWGLSSVLGTLDVTPFEMVQAYTVLANYGQYIPLHGINEITNSDDQVIYQYRVPQGIQVMSPQVAFLITSVLEDNKTRGKDFGLCSPLYLYPHISAPNTPQDMKGECGGWINHPSKNTLTYPAGANAWPAAVKTGTGQDFQDDWTMGYTMDYTMGVWVGNNDHTTMINMDGVTGAAPIWHNTMLYAEKNLPKRGFPVPSGVYQASYTSNGITSTDWFIQGMKLPANVGNGGPDTLPCIKFNDDANNPWDYSSGKCQGKLIPGGPAIR